MQIGKLELLIADDGWCRVLHFDCTKIVIDVRYKNLEHWENTHVQHIISPEQFRGHIFRLAAGALSEYMKREGLLG